MMPITELDKALLEANDNPEKRGPYYVRFLNSQIFIPVHEDADEAYVEEKVSGSFYPFIENDGDGRFLMIFDHQDKMRAWSHINIGFQVAPGYELFHIFRDVDLNWVLNYGTDYLKVFSPPELKDIREFIECNHVEIEQSSEGIKYGLIDECALPPEVEEALREAAANNTKITAMFIGEIIQLGNHDKPTLTIVLQTEGLADERKRGLANRMGLVIGKWLPPDKHAEFLFDDGNSLARDIVAKGWQIYARRGGIF